MDQMPMLTGRMQLGLPVGTLRAIIARAEDAGQERLYLTMPTSLLQEAIAAAVAGRDADVVGHHAGATGLGQDELVAELELDDADFNVAGLMIRW